MSIFTHTSPRFVRALTTALIVLGLCACAPRQPVPSAAAPAPHMAVAGDVLGVVITGENDLSGEYPIDESGAITMPMVGKIAVAGKTLPGITAAIDAAYRGDYLITPDVHVVYRAFCARVEGGAQ